jgi:hypothetical protein
MSGIRIQNSEAWEFGKGALSANYQKNMLEQR